MKQHLGHAALILTIFLVISGCGMRRSSAPQARINLQDPNLQNLRDFRLDRFFEGPQTFLVIPNPIDSAQLKSFDFSPADFQKAQVSLGLPDLQSASALDNAFLKVRVRSRFDSQDQLVKPQELSSATSNIQDPKYSQVMAYHAISAITKYIKALGFAVDRSRELYVMVRSNPDPETTTPSPASQEINAYYVHNTFQPSKPRYIQLLGDVKYPLGADRDVYWHEFGHLFNESLSANRGIDDAGEKGALYTEAGAIHECLADYLSESASQKGFIGRWTARNLPEIKSGYPLRAAISLNDNKNYFSSVANYSSSKGAPEKYDVAEWCSRVLWAVRSQFEAQNKETGGFVSDRTVFAAVSLLPKNASLSDFKNALIESDKALNQGAYSGTINGIFTQRGFPDRGAPLGQALQLQATPIGFREFNGQITAVSPNGSADEIFFSLVIYNPNGSTARNVRLQILSSDPAVVPYVEMQSFGDLSGGASIRVSGSQYKDFLASVSLALDKRSASGRPRARFSLKVISENAAETVIPVELPL